MERAPSTVPAVARGRRSPAEVLGSAAAPVLCALVAWATFAEVLRAGFVHWDDPWIVSENPRLGGLTWAALRDVLLDASRSSRAYTPLAGLRYNLVRQLSGLDPRAFHAANLLVHAVSAALVLWLVRSLLRLARGGDASAASEAPDDLAAIAAALLWALHPMRVEVVGWVSGGAHEQAALFVLLSLLAHVGAVRASGRRRTTLDALSVAGYACAVLSQPAALGLPGALVAFDWWWGRRRGQEPSPRRLLAGAAPHLAVAAAALVANGLVLALAPVEWQRPAGLAEFGVVPRVAQALYVLAWFVWRPLVPGGLSPVYPDLVVFDPWSLPFLASALGVAGVLLAAWRARRRWPAAWALAASYVSLLAPALGWTDHPHYPNDRYSTAAALVGSVAVAAVLSRLRPGRRVAGAAALCGVLAAALVPATVRQCAVWRDSETLFRHMLATLGDAPAAGAEVWRVGLRWRLGAELERQRRVPEAAAQYVAALALAPRQPVAGKGLLRLCEDGGRRARREALACYRRALDVGPEVVAASWTTDPGLGACVPRCTGAASGFDGCGGVCEGPR